ncbi:hypothetical protein PTKIN_Ptkin04bG0162400 [Pterospermum kingtungense]
MKKTLVFYKGRAPKGQRTNWIMHEYRATTKDLDGTAPGQGAFVLCRLFHKPEEKNDAQKNDEDEQTGYSPTMTKSSPDDISSDLQDTVLYEMQSQKLVNLMQNGQVTGDSSCNSHMTSDAAEETVAEKYSLLGDDSILCEPNFGEIDHKVFSPMNSNFFEDLQLCMDSPYASDFGHGQNGFHFLDGTSEQDVSFSMLDKILKNHDDSYEELNSERNLTARTEMPLSSNAFISKTIAPETSYLKGNGIYGDTDTEMSQLLYDKEVGAPRWFGGHSDNKDSLQMQTSFEFGNTQTSPYNRECRTGSIGDLGNYSIGQATSSTAASANIDNLQQLTCLKNYVNNGGGTGLETRTYQPPEQSNSENFGTGIKIRPHGPQQRPNTDNILNQGTASRRIRLEKIPSTGPMKFSAGCVDDGKMRSAGLDEEEEVQSTLTEVTKEEATGQTSGSDESDKENQVPRFDSGDIVEESSTKQRRRVKPDGEHHSSKTDPSLHSKVASLHHHSSSIPVLVSTVFIITILLLALIMGIWR